MIKFLKKIISYLSFGLKSANDDMFSQKEGSMSDNNISQVQESKNVYKDLRKGEVTQEVEELRYSTYNVYRESNNYQYLGDGLAIKKDIDKNKNEYHFTLHNNLICDGVLDSMDKYEKNDFGVDKYTISIKYDYIPRFRLERFCKMVEVDTYGDNANIKLHFSTFYDTYDSTSKSFLNEIEKISKLSSYYEISKNEICSNISSISFTTYKCNGDDDLINYEFNDIDYLNFEKNYFEYIITYKSKYTRLDLLDKYFSKSMDNKYKNNESKTKTLDLTNTTRQGTCDVCGNDMSIYDYDITKETYGYSICIKCLEDILKNEKK